jgi:hypothetical protein
MGMGMGMGMGMVRHRAMRNDHTNSAWYGAQPNRDGTSPQGAQGARHSHLEQLHGLMLREAEGSPRLGSHILLRVPKGVSVVSDTAHTADST